MQIKVSWWDCGTSLNVTYPIWTLNAGESFYLYQSNNHTSKGVMTFELLPF
jgi:hypothetical protein